MARVADEILSMTIATSDKFIEEQPGAIEITPEMIEAGVEELYCHPIAADEPTEDDMRLAVIETYKAMVLAH